VGHFYLGYFDNDKNNGAIYTLVHLLQIVVASAAEAELAGLFQVCQEASHFRRALEFLG